MTSNDLARLGNAITNLAVHTDYIERIAKGANVALVIDDESDNEYPPINLNSFMTLKDMQEYQKNLNGNLVKRLEIAIEDQKKQLANIEVDWKKFKFEIKKS